MFANFKKVKLENVCEILDSQRVPITSSLREFGAYPYYGANGIQDYVNKYIFDDELVLLAEDGGSFCSKDKPIAYRVSGKCWVNNHAHVLKPTENLDVDYLCYSLMYYDVSNIINGTTRMKLTQASMRKMLIPYPPLKEQKYIVSILKKAEDLIFLRKQQLAKLNQLVTSKFIEMFGDPVFNSKCWEKDVLSNYIDFLTSGSRGWAKYFSEDGEIFITIKNVKNNRIILDDVQYVLPPDNKEAIRTRVKSGDLLISITADLGRTGVVSEEIASHGAYINQHLCIVRLKQALLNPIFLSYYLESSAGKQQFERKNQNGVKAGLNFAAINSLEILIPPLEFQDQFSSFVTQVETQKNLVKQSLDLLELNKKSLMQQYFGA